VELLVLKKILLSELQPTLYIGWFSLGTPVSSTNKTDRHDIAEILLKVALNTIIQTNKQSTLIIIIM
jgi:hypothetical protein